MTSQVLLVAKRDFIATVSRKGFLFGLLLMPVIGLVFALAVPRFMASRAPRVTGQVLVVDESGGTIDGLTERLRPESILARRTEQQRRSVSQVDPALASGMPANPLAGANVPQLRVESLPPGTQVDAVESRLQLAPGAAAPDALALIVVARDALRREAGRGYGSYQLYVSPRLDDSTENTLHESLRLALLEARFRADGLDPAAVEDAMRVDRPRTVVVGGGEQAARRGLNRTLPFIMGLLLFLGVIVGGQALMTSTIEEKSNRVVEVLLAAVSPLSLMWGKLLGQLGIGLLTIAVYVLLGLAALGQFALLGLLDPVLIPWLFVFFLVAYLTFGSLMLSIGAAVNQPAEAQSLMGPLMLLLILPYVLTPMIGQSPNSTLSVVLSLVPPLNTFAMLARLASYSPPPLWQVLLSLAFGIAATAGAVWFASKVYRVGLLMHGKPPNFATLVRWVRMA